ncbi:hypothetical protein [Peptacetobacter sp. AB800]|uniref:hypothetical protein n=1 Tax=Peptacetobacter sp. AB800 TaxID=3388428 RepID=UPI0039FD2B19
MNDIILNRIELKNILRFFGKDIIEGIEHKRRKEPLKDNLNCSNSELLEHIEETREKRRNTRIMISRLHIAYKTLSEEKQILLKLRLIDCNNWNYTSKKIGYSERTLRDWENNALNEILNKYNELLEIEIDENLFDDMYFLDI